MNSIECRTRAENVLMHTYGRYPVVLDHGDGVYLYEIPTDKCNFESIAYKELMEG